MLFTSLIAQLLPRACLLCRTLTQASHHLCEPCRQELPILSHSCRKCAQFLHANERQLTLCGQCLTDPPPFDQVYALFPYLPPLPRMIAAFKFEEQFSYGACFSTLLREKIREWYQPHPLPDLLIPVPLHASRLRERGFNQTLELIKPLAHTYKIPIDQSVIRHKATAAQHLLPKRERLANTANAFQVVRSYQNRHVAIIDDVMTTGQTVSALARLLKQAGASKVDIWAIARSDGRALN